MNRIFILVSFVFVGLQGFSQLLIIDIPEHRFRIDPYSNIIVVQRQNLDEFANLSTYDSINLVLTSFEYSFVEIPSNLQFTGTYTVNNGTEDYSLFFTTLPLLKIDAPINIPDEPKVAAQFFYADSDQILIATIGIEKRGGVSQGYPKRTYDLEFWEDETGTVKVDVQFGDMRLDDDWILDGMYNEPLRIRAHSASQLWLDLHEPHYLSLQPNAQAGAKSGYVELFMYGRYQGIYLLSEQIDRKLLKVMPLEDTIEGELYKGEDFGENSTFESLPDFDNNSREWVDYEMKYPDDTTNWQNLYDFTDFVMHSSEQEFTSIWNKFSRDNYIDYFIFLNTIRATDNTGKNIYTAKYSSETPYFYVPWDLDGCFGTIWTGSYVNITNDILGNNFHDRVINSNVNNYWQTVRERWYELRPNILHPDSLIERLNTSFQVLQSNNVYAREMMVFPNYPFDQNSFDHMADWITDRIAFLDVYFEYNPLGLFELSRSKFSIFPNPASENIQLLESSDLIGEPYQIIDLQGKTVLSYIYMGHTINISNLESGLYLFKIGEYVNKIVVQ